MRRDEMIEKIAKLEDPKKYHLVMKCTMNDGNIYTWGSENLQDLYNHPGDIIGEDEVIGGGHETEGGRCEIDPSYEQRVRILNNTCYDWVHKAHNLLQHEDHIFLGHEYVSVNSSDVKRVWLTYHIDDTRITK